MDNAKRDAVRMWPVKAGHDLKAAAIIAEEDAGLLDVAIFHCQQAVEKALKGFLVFNGEPFSKTHDLKTLALQAAKHDSGFTGLLEVADSLTPYATRFRYPTSDMPEVDEYDGAFSDSKRMVQFVLSLIPSEAHP
jgi:HEPN domain-containing protein